MNSASCLQIISAALLGLSFTCLQAQQSEAPLSKEELQEIRGELKELRDDSKRDLDTITLAIKLWRAEFVQDCMGTVPHEQTCECLADSIPVSVGSFADYSKIMLARSSIDVDQLSQESQEKLNLMVEARRNCLLANQ